MRLAVQSDCGSQDTRSGQALQRENNVLIEDDSASFRESEHGR